MSARVEDVKLVEPTSDAEVPMEAAGQQSRNPLRTVLAILILPLSLGLALLMVLLTVVLGIKRLFDRFRL